LIFFRHLLN